MHQASTHEELTHRHLTGAGTLPASALREVREAPVMPQYTVTWTIDQDAADPVDAARRALAVHPHYKPASWATVTTVTDGQNEYVVDLDPDGIGTEQATPTCTTNTRPSLGDARGTR